MSDTEEGAKPPKPKRHRGPYKQYLEPGRNYVIPESTLRSRSKKDRSNLVSQQSESEGNVVCEDSPKSTGDVGTAGLGGHAVNQSDESDSSSQLLDNEGRAGGQEKELTSYEEGGFCSSSDESLDQQSNNARNTSSFEKSSSDDLSDTEQQTSGMKERFGFSSYTLSTSEEETAPGGDDADRQTMKCLAVCKCGKCPQLQAETDLSDEGSGREGDTPLADDQQESDPTEDRRRKWKDKHSWDEPVHPHLKVTKFEVLLMLFNLFIRHNMTYVLVTDILKFVNCILGLNVLSTSQYMFKKLFEPNCKMLTHVFCPSCEAYLGELNGFKNPQVTCTCGETSPVKELRDNNSFITIGIADSLKYCMRRPETKLIQPEARVEGVYRDVMDGEMYRSKIGPELEKGKNVISLSFNTDGAKVFKSNNKMSMWPIQFIINELDPRERFKEANVFLAGMWYGRGSPNMSTFFAPFINELESLAEHGVELVTSTGQKVLYYVYALICSIDSGAKPKLLRQKAHNGKFSCGFCLHPNLPVPGYAKNLLRFVEKEGRRQLKFSDRTHRSMIDDMLKADELDRQGKLGQTFDSVNGLFGISCCAAIPKFDVARGFVVDYLHTLLLGVTRALIRLLFDSKEQRTESHDPSSQIGAVERRLSSMKPPHGMSTHSRLFSERDDWKGKELRMFALVYALPCLYGLPKISERHFRHLQKFVTALQILLGTVITSEQLQRAESLLDEFVLEFQDIYGSIHMTLNVHLLKHVANVVRWWGPLWCYSNFAFESGNGRLARLVRGTNGVISQICEKYLAVLTVSDFLMDTSVNTSVLEFCGNIMNYSYVKNSEKIDDTTRVLDGEKIVRLTAESEDRAAIMESGFPSLMEATVVQCYNRVVYRGAVYYSKTYTRPVHFDDTCVKLTDGSYAITEKFVKTSESPTLYVIIRPIQFSVNDAKLAPLISTGAFNFFGRLRVIDIHDIVAKCVCIQLENNYNYVCELPNHVERD